MIACMIPVIVSHCLSIEGTLVCLDCEKELQDMASVHHDHLCSSMHFAVFESLSSTSMGYSSLSAGPCSSSWMMQDVH